MLDATFLRPIAHRGLHEAARGIVENSAPAFAAAIAGGHGIECDLQPGAGGRPLVFHDATLDRLIEGGSGPLAGLEAGALGRLRYRDAPGERILELGEMLDLVNGRTPLLVEVKSDWRPPVPAFLDAVAVAVAMYRGPLALMSFDPAVMAAMRARQVAVPCGIVSGVYREPGWWSEVLAAERRERLTHLLETRAVMPDFIAYHVDDLPTPVTRFVREALGLPLLAWTVRTAAHWQTARTWADAAIFEGQVPPP